MVIALEIVALLTILSLAPEAQAYIEYVQETAEVSIGWVSVGPERSQLIEIS